MSAKGGLLPCHNQRLILRIVLGFLSLLLAIGGVLLIFSSKPFLVRVFMHPPEVDVSILFLAAAALT